MGGEHRWQVQRDGHVRSSSTRVVTSRKPRRDDRGFRTARVRLDRLQAVAVMQAHFVLGVESARARQGERAGGG